ncbi:YHS domain-containing (seleno)protein [Muricauda sp. ANG21]|uniref:YHS domain-containing (seleno)protein n=1 Tax=Allomuricauda sp. ANG21 TaxID=3042468 RepID=UPI0034514D7B
MKTVKQVFALAVALLWGAFAQAQIDPVNTDGVALGGYDVVSYFSGKAKEGKKTFAAKHNEVTYYFASKANRDAFTKAPKKYLPQFDGYCAWGVGAKAAKFPINPETFDIVDGKLYLFFDGEFNGEQLDTSVDWKARTAELEKAAHTNWPNIKDSK